MDELIDLVSKSYDNQSEKEKKEILKSADWLNRLSESSNEIIEIWELKNLKRLFVSNNFEDLTGEKPEKGIDRYFNMDDVRHETMQVFFQSESFLSDVNKKDYYNYTKHPVFFKGVQMQVHLSTFRLSNAVTLTRTKLVNSESNYIGTKIFHHHRQRAIKEISTTRQVLTEREKDVVELLAKGFSDKEISEKLFISPYTVLSHRRNIIKKMNAKNTVEAVVKAFDLL
jgi:DNA-binding CsgD family transcriptional regulator